MTDSEVIARSSNITIGPGVRVSLHFSILLATGEEVDTTRRGKPASFVFGDGNLLAGFERLLVGMQTGDDAQIPVPPDQGFGERDPGNIRRLPVRQFSQLDELEPGLMVSFQSPEGELPGVLLAVDDELATVDFNHPLAGRDLVFDVSILGVELV